MPRLRPVDAAETDGRARDLLDEIENKIGMVPNLMRTMASSAAVLEAYEQFKRALGGGRLPARLREQIALTVAEANACGYCLAAHAALGKLAGLSDETIRDSRLALSPNRKTEEVLRFAREIVEKRGLVGDEAVDRVRRAGLGDGEIAEIVANVALNLFTNYFNHVAGTEVDFPSPSPVALAASGPVAPSGPAAA
jgi:uncharacterized peroxidase-related enzyme